MRGRVLAAPANCALRPTQDAVREAVFSMLAAVIRGSSFLDLYAGTGAVGLEALSRGAASVAWVEKNPKIARVLESNVSALCGGAPPQGSRIFRADAEQWLKRPPRPGGSVDIVFADPPYVEREGERDSMPELAAAAAAGGILAEGAFFVAEQREGTPLDTPCGFELLTRRRYGRTAVSLLKWVGGR